MYGKPVAQTCCNALYSFPGCVAKADFSQANVPQTSQVVGVYVDSHYIFSWLDSGLRKMVHTNLAGVLQQAGNVASSALEAVWQDTTQWTSADYSTTNFERTCVSGSVFLFMRTSGVWVLHLLEFKQIAMMLTLFNVQQVVSTTPR